MKYKLNLNPSSGFFLAAIAGLAFGLPLLFELVFRLLAAAGARLEMLRGLAQVSFWAGTALLAGWLILILVEAVQDRWMDAAYRRSLGRPLAAEGGALECPYCGSRKVKAFDHTCPACGKTLSP